MSSTNYDYAIVGAGAAGLQLALAMKADPFFHTKRVLIVDKSSKTENDKTWCYWEAGAGTYDHLLTHNWTSGLFYNNARKTILQLAPYRYKMLRSIDFYEFALKELKKVSFMEWKQEEVHTILQKKEVEIQTSEGCYLAKHVFDSRMENDFFESADSSLRLLQHFRGWYIKTTKDFFDPTKFVMMDFRLRWKDSTSFTYVLPTSTTTALVEFTLFSPTLLKEEEYQQLLKKYVDEILKPGEYTIQEKEAGVIPMTDYPFQKNHSSMVTKIGTAGGWVKPSSGYSFKNGNRFSKQLIANIKAGRRPSFQVAVSRFRLYDALLLDILVNKNHLGPFIFSDMYAKNSLALIFAFLDEQTSWLQDANIIRKFNWPPFLKALLAYPFRKLRR
jgi:lycopene beta-cyclase